MTEARSLVPPFRAPAREEQRGRAAGLLDAAGGGRGGLRGGRAGRTVVKVPQQPRRVPPPGQGVLQELTLGARLRHVNDIILGGFRGLRHGRQPGRNLAPQRWRNSLIIILGEEVKVAACFIVWNPGGGGAEGAACRSRCAILGACRSSAGFFASLARLVRALRTRRTPLGCVLFAFGPCLALGGRSTSKKPDERSAGLCAALRPGVHRTARDRPPFRGLSFSRCCARNLTPLPICPKACISS